MPIRIEEGQEQRAIQGTSTIPDSLKNQASHEDVQMQAQ